jgi:hypothetical protein
VTENPINLTVRFLIEIAMLISLGVAGWHVPGPFWERLFAAMSAPVAAAVLWGIVATKNDVVRGTAAPIMVPGWTRLLLELLLFGAAIAALYGCGFLWAATIFALVVVIQNIASYDRWVRLLSVNR